MNWARKVFLLIVAAACIAITVHNVSDVEILDYGTMYIVDEYVDTFYESLSDNVGITTVNGISNVYINMAADGYSVYKEDVTSTYIDVSFIKEGFPSYRYYYEHPKGRITFFCSDYENSYTGAAYINDKKEKSVGQ